MGLICALPTNVHMSICLVIKIAFPFSMQCIMRGFYGGMSVQDTWCLSIPRYNVGLHARKPVFGGLPPTQAQTSLQTDQRLCYSLIKKYHI